MNHKKILFISLIITLVYFAITTAIIYFGYLGKVIGTYSKGRQETPMEVFMLIILLPSIGVFECIARGQFSSAILFILVVFAVFSGLTYLFYFIKKLR